MTIIGFFLALICQNTIQSCNIDHVNHYVSILFKRIVLFFIGTDENHDLNIFQDTLELYWDEYINNCKNEKYF